MEQLMEAIRLFRKKQFDSSSEKLSEDAYEQLSLLFNEAEAYLPMLEKKEMTTVSAHTRQEQEWNRQGVKISRQTMSNWILRAAEDWLKPVYEVLHRNLVQHEVLHADETTLQVLKEPGKSAQSKSYMWLYRTGGDSAHPIVLYEYSPNRKPKNAEIFLEGFKGWLHADGYPGYHSLPENICVVGCWAHAQRKFDEAVDSLPKREQANSAALEGQQYCSALFALEKEFAGLTAEERYKQRQERAKPILDALLAWSEIKRSLRWERLCTICANNGHG